MSSHAAQVGPGSEPLAVASPLEGLADVSGSGLSYPYISQLETGDREPALKAMRALAPVLDVRPEELAALVAGGNWATTGHSSYESAVPAARPSTQLPQSPGYNRDKVLLSLERRPRDVPPLERISLLNELIALAVEELSQKRP